MKFYKRGGWIKICILIFQDVCSHTSSLLFYYYILESWSAYSFKCRYTRGSPDGCQNFWEATPFPDLASIAYSFVFPSLYRKLCQESFPPPTFHKATKGFINAAVFPTPPAIQPMILGKPHFTCLSVIFNYNYLCVSSPQYSCQYAYHLTRWILEHNPHS